MRDTDSVHFNMMPSEAQLSKHLAALGVGNSKDIVCYDQGNGMWAARAAFVLSAHGLKVHWLAGGLQGWTGDKQQGESNKGCDASVELKYNGESNVLFEEVQKIVSGEI